MPVVVLVAVTTHKNVICTKTTNVICTKTTNLTLPQQSYLHQFRVLYKAHSPHLTRHDSPGNPFFPIFFLVKKNYTLTYLYHPERPPERPTHFNPPPEGFLRSDVFGGVGLR